MVRRLSPAEEYMELREEFMIETDALIRNQVPEYRTRALEFIDAILDCTNEVLLELIPGNIEPGEE